MSSRLDVGSAFLRLRGLRAGNLRDVALDLPHGRWTAIHGPSGAGKSALLFGVLEPVARRRFRVLRDPAALPEGAGAELSRVADAVEGLQPVLALAGEVPRRRAAVEVGTALDLWPLLAEAWSRHGARRCAACGTEWRAPAREELAAEIAGAAADGDPIHVLSAAGGAPPAELLRAGWTRVRIGAGLCRLEEAPDPLPAGAWLLLDRFRWSSARRARLAEAVAEALRRGRAARWEAGARHGEIPPAEACPRCGAAVPARSAAELGSRRSAPDVVLSGRAWDDWCAAPLEDWISLPGVPAGGRMRLTLLSRTGLGHLSATRTLGTLSLGEARRLELVAVMSQVRCGQLVLCDEPGMGLHGSERRELARLLRELCSQGNTVLTADPSREFLEAADEWVELGPGGGPEGGRVVARGTAARLPAGLPLEPPRCPAAGGAGAIVFTDLRARCLDIPELRLPLGCLVAVAGVSGSGKSTLLEEELVPRLRSGRSFQGPVPEGGMAVLLERALGHAASSTVATLSGAWDEIRAAFAAGEEGRIRGLSPSDLVAQEGRGACPSCSGRGGDADGLPCAACQGLGLRADLLELRLQQRSLREWLTAPIARLEKRLPARGRLRALARAMVALGLGGRSFGERGRHLSLGERSRIALARALAAARRTRPKLFLLDEPCLGLPAADASRVAGFLRELSAQGHSLWVVDHHEVLLRSADWVVELGPGAGPRGGKLLFAGPPDALLRADTPTGRWMSGAPPRRAASRACRAAPPPRSEALQESWRREGRLALERALERELSTRSPLLADLAAGGQEPESRPALPPMAWPAAPPAGATLLQVLGLEPPLDEALRRSGEPSCATCGGPGPWLDLVEAARSGAPGSLPAGEWVFSTPLDLSPGARASAPLLLQAAGFRVLLRGGALLRLEEAAPLRAEDEVWLDRFDPRDAASAGRLRDVEHHARLLGGGRVRASAAGRRPWSYRTGACRDCGRGDPSLPAPTELRQRGRNRGAFLALPLGDALGILDVAAPGAGPFRRAAELLAGTPLLRHPAGAPWRCLAFLERRLARLVGWLLFPLEGMTLLHDQPLSGLPPELAARLRRELLRAPAGAHRFTDPEGSGPPARAGAAAPAARGDLRLQGFGLELDLEGWARPPWLPPSTTLREALGLVEALQEHFLRTEEARLRGWTRNDLVRGPGGRVCSGCRGSGGARPHPELLLPCRACSGTGWSRETAALEDRGLRWPDLGAIPVGELREHFADTPALARPLEVASSLGFGSVPLDTPLWRLPLGSRQLAPLARWLSRSDDSRGLRLAAAAAGLNPVEALRLASTMTGYLSGSESPEWRDHHPALLSPA